MISHANLNSISKLKNQIAGELNTNLMITLTTEGASFSNALAVFHNTATMLTN
jgi:hypothetical protein